MEEKTYVTLELFPKEDDSIIFNLSFTGGDINSSKAIIKEIKYKGITYEPEMFEKILDDTLLM